MPNRLHEASDLETMWRLDLPYLTPPLSANGRYHWAKKARLTKQVRDDVHLLARAARIPPQAFVSVQLHYRPRGAWRMDPPNLCATSKPAIDGLVDAGVVPDDTAEFVTELMPVIHPAGKPAALWLVVWVAG